MRTFSHGILACEYSSPEKNKPNYIIGGLIGFGIIFIFGRISKDFNFAKYNAFDWLGIALNLIQIFSMYYVYAGIKNIIKQINKPHNLLANILKILHLYLS